MATHVQAVWIGPSGYVLVDGTVLERGQTVVSVPEFEAVESENWLPVAPHEDASSTDEDND